MTYCAPHEDSLLMPASVASGSAARMHVHSALAGMAFAGAIDPYLNVVRIRADWILGIGRPVLVTHQDSREKHAWRWSDIVGLRLPGHVLTLEKILLGCLKEYNS